jgi:hypothetical protein
MSNSETQVLNRWHNYFANGGSADFEVFYAHSTENQNLLVKVAKGWAKINGGN